MKLSQPDTPSPSRVRLAKRIESVRNSVLTLEFVILFCQTYWDMVFITLLFFNVFYNYQRYSIQTATFLLDVLLKEELQVIMQLENNIAQVSGYIIK